MALFKKQKNTRRRPLINPNSRDVSSFKDYYRSESKRTNTSAQSTNNNKKAPQRRLKVSAKASYIPTYLAVIVIVFSLIYSSIINNNVSVVVHSDQGLYSKNHYEDIAKKLMQRSVFNKSKFTIDTRAFKEDLAKEVPEIKDVSLSIPLAGKKPVIGLTFVKPLYVFSVNNKDYIVGDNGVILADANEIESFKKEKLHYIKDEAPLNVSIGKPVLLSSDIDFLESMYKELAIANIEVVTAKLPLGAGELHVQVKDKKYIIKLSLTGNAAQQVGAYLAVLKNIESASLAQEYIDVRLGERVFVK